MSKGAAGLLDDQGVFAESLPGFAPRQEQIELAIAIETAIDQQQSLIAEAGTGVGKTLAYLIPVLLSGERAIISTGTKTLQDQLYFRDLPMVRKALKSSAETALLKGRANYLCLYRMQQARTEGRLPSRKAVSELERVNRWSMESVDGDLSNATVITDESGLWPLVTSTADNCLGSECPDFQDCFVVKARRLAQEADVVVVNHHLLFADMAIKQSGFGEVLPGASIFVVDEAHQAPETASQFFSHSLSARQIRDLCADLMAEGGKLSGGLAMVQEPIQACQQALKEMQAVFSEHLPERGTWKELLSYSELRQALQGLDSSILALEPVMEPLKGRERSMDACIERLAELKQRLDLFDSPESGEEVRWFERRGKGFALHITPMNVADTFNEFRERQPASWIFTSATLSVSGRCDHFVHRMGLDDASTALLDSPFDYANNALLWLPSQLPEPRDRDFVPQLLSKVLPVIEASQGRAFLLFTSHRALRQAAEWLESEVDFPLFIQGDAPRSILLEQFRESGNGILLGAASFWEGVDVAGAALSLVVIDKLPFAAPDDPVMDARSQALRRQGGNPFVDLFMPQAVIALKQGSGRLIRDVTDRGVLVICDSRLKTKSYGKIFLNSLPPMKVTEDRDEVVDFFAEAEV